MFLTILTMGVKGKPMCAKDDSDCIICGTRTDCRGTWFSKDWYILLTVLQSMSFALAHRLLVGRGHFDCHLCRFTDGRKTWIDKIVVVSAQWHQGITQSKMARAPFFFGFDWVTWKARFNSSLPPTTFTYFGTCPLFTTFNPCHMAFSRTRMPSFTLVLTSAQHSLHGYPTTIKFDLCASYTMLPAVIDHLLVTNPLFLCGNSWCWSLRPLANQSSWWGSGQQSGTYRPIGELGISACIVNVFTRFVLRTRLRRLTTKSLHLSVVRKKRLLRLPRSVLLNLNAHPSFNIFVAICIDGYSFPQKEVVWTD
jgi:hypothetical protein